ncbi:MAG: hypothetical protein ACFCVA_00720 [Gammaproteobacteria bacterium]
MAAFTETIVEAALAWLEASVWPVAHGPEIAPDQPRAERVNYGEVVLARRLRDALARLNPGLSAEALEELPNGCLMKWATLMATMDRLGIAPSYSRPRVSHDNPFSEAAFRTCASTGLISRCGVLKAWMLRG